MVGMLQILTYLLAFYLVLKGVEILQIAMASNRPQRTGIIVFGMIVLISSVLAAGAFVTMQDRQALSVGSQMRAPGQ